MSQSYDRPEVEAEIATYITRPDRDNTPLAFEIHWLDWNGERAGLSSVYALSLDMALDKAARKIQRPGPDKGAQAAHGFYVKVVR